MNWETYKVVRSTEEAFEYIGHFQGKARVVAGGTDLIPQLREKETGDGIALLDVSSIPEMREIGLTDNGEWVMVGAAATMTEIAQSEIIARYGRALAMGASCMGAPQIRNVATIGGNVVNAQPAADGTIPLLALGAEARIISANGERWAALEGLFVDVGKSAVNPSEEIVTHFRFRPCPKTASSSLQRLAKRKAFTLPTLVAACRVQLDAGKRVFEDVRLALGPVARTPWLASEAADSMRGEPVGHEAIRKAAAATKAAAQPRDSIRGGAEYRKDMVEVLIKRAVTECLELIGVDL